MLMKPLLMVVETINILMETSVNTTFGYVNLLNVSPIVVVHNVHILVCVWSIQPTLMPFPPTKYRLATRNPVSIYLICEVIFEYTILYTLYSDKFLSRRLHDVQVTMLSFSVDISSR